MERIQVYVTKVLLETCKDVKDWQKSDRINSSNALHLISFVTPKGLVIYTSTPFTNSDEPVLIQYIVPVEPTVAHLNVPIHVYPGIELYVKTTLVFPVLFKTK